ncbi:MAG: DUF2470 domain-containing protein [Methylophilaceae bacterium]
MSIASEARQFLRCTRSGILSTISAKFAGYPFGSVAPFVLDQDGQPLILISTLAEHTRNIIANPKVSLLVFAGAEDLQANSRLTLMGDASKVTQDDNQLRARYLRYFPQAKGYFDTHDFSFYRISIQQARYIGGFGRISWVAGAELTSPPNTLAAQEAGILAHMNADHADSLIAYCKHFHNLTTSSVSMLGIDSDGFDVLAGKDADEQADNKTLRFSFDQPITDALSARTALVAMSKAIRA